MSAYAKSILVCLLLGLAVGSSTPSNPVQQFYSDFRQGIAYKKGLTFTATIWPEEKNSFVGRMSCNGCNPQLGDTACTQRLPLLCIVHPKVLSRPYYNYYPDFTPYANPDQSFYEGWTGGIIAVTDPVRGIEVTSYATGDNLCKTAFGAKAKFAQFTDGWYMSNMNGPNLNIEKSWDWSKAKSGEYNFWGYFNHNYLGLDPNHSHWKLRAPAQQPHQLIIPSSHFISLALFAEIVNNTEFTCSSAVCSLQSAVLERSEESDLLDILKQLYCSCQTGQKTNVKILSQRPSFIVHSLRGVHTTSCLSEWAQLIDQRES